MKRQMKKQFTGGVTSNARIQTRHHHRLFQWARDRIGLEYGDPQDSLGEKIRSKLFPHSDFTLKVNHWHFDLYLSFLTIPSYSQNTVAQITTRIPWPRLQPKYRGPDYSQDAVAQVTTRMQWPKLGGQPERKALGPQEYSPSSLWTMESVCTRSQNLYVSQQTKTGTLKAFATRAIWEVPTLDIT